VLETGAVVVALALARLAEMPSLRVQEMVAPEQRRLSQGLFSHTPVVAVAEVVPIAILQRRVELVVTAVAETARRRPTPLRHACR
jgi:hypothetical protein